MTKLLKYLSISVTVFAVIALIAINKAKNMELSVETKTLGAIEFYDSYGNLIHEIGNTNKNNWIELDKISPLMIDAILAIEDHTFYQHNGFNYQRIGKAIFENILSWDKAQGASTITQQYARNLYLTLDKTYKRKFQEAYYTIALESNFTKDQILEGYLNTIYFGHGMYGIENASEFYFGKSATELNLVEATTLSAVPKGPSYYSPINDFDANLNRSQLILNLMKKQNKITEKEYIQALNSEVKITGELNTKEKMIDAPYYMDVILQELAKLDMEQNIYKTLKVYTTLDPKIQTIAEDAVGEHLAEYGELQSAVVVTKPITGDVLALVGGSDYEQSNYNRAIASTRHAGSTVKPILYYTALENDLRTNSTFKSEPTTFYVNGGLQSYSPTNYNDTYANSDITMPYALATSDNIYAVKTHLYLGEQKLSNSLKQFKITDEVTPLPSLALGAVETSLLNLTNSYNIFASNGKTVDPVFISKITTSGNEIVYENSNETRQILQKDTTFIINQMMTGMFDTRLNFGEVPVTGGSLNAKISRQYAGKSGSTDVDSWMVGYSPDFVVGVWSGYDENQFITKGESKVSKYIWADIIEQLHVDVPYRWFERPDNVFPLYVEPLYGNVLSRRTSTSQVYYFTGDNMPIKY